MSSTDPAPFPVVVDGVLHAAGTPLLPVEDRAFQLGHGVFETLRVAQGRALFLAAHLARLERGARALGIHWPPASDPRVCVSRLVAALETPSCALRLTLSAGVERPVLVASARPIVPWPPEGVRARLSALRVPLDGLANVKSTSRLRYTLARQEAGRHGAQEALLLNAEGDLAEGSVSNVFVVRAGCLLTPDTGRGVLPGLQRERLLADLEQRPLLASEGGPLALEVRLVTRQELEGAEEILLTNSIQRVAGVARLDLPGQASRELSGSSGPCARALLDRSLVLEALEARERGAPAG